MNDQFGKTVAIEGDTIVAGANQLWAGGQGAASQLEDVGEGEAAVRLRVEAGLAVAEGALDVGGVCPLNANS